MSTIDELIRLIEDVKQTTTDRGIISKIERLHNLARIEQGEHTNLVSQNAELVAENKRLIFKNQDDTPRTAGDSVGME